MDGSLRSPSTPPPPHYIHLTSPHYIHYILCTYLTTSPSLITPHVLNLLALPLPVHGVSPTITLAPPRSFQQQSPRDVMDTLDTFTFVAPFWTVHHARLRLGSVIEHALGYLRALYPDADRA